MTAQGFNDLEVASVAGLFQAFKSLSIVIPLVKGSRLDYAFADLAIHISPYSR
jgi:hypothetical protein